MRYCFLTIFLLLSFNVVEACTIETYPSIYKSSSFEDISKDQLIKKTDCSKEIQSQFLKSISNIRGSVNSKQLSRIIDPALEITPARVTVESLEDFIKDQLSIPPVKFVRNIKFSRKRSFLPLEAYQSLHVSCDTCEFLGRKNIKFTLNSTDDENFVYYWAEIDLQMQSLSLVAKQNLKVTQTPLDPDMFETKVIYSHSPEQFFIKKDVLKYYRLNRTIHINEPLQANAITPVHLVRPGVPVSIELNQSGIKLSGKAIPSRAGHLGDIVQLKNLKSKKNILGKVIDFNKVLVEL